MLANADLSGGVDPSTDAEPFDRLGSGRFLVVNDPRGTAKIETAAGHRITGLTGDAARPISAEAVSPSGAAAAGVTFDKKSESSGAMGHDEFVARFRSYRGQ